MKIMYITTALRAPNGVCTSNIIEALMKAGHKVIVFTQKNNNEVKCPCSVVYSKYRNIHSIKESLSKIVAGKKIQKIMDLLYRVWTVVCYPIWPINSPLFVHMFPREAYKVLQRNKVDMVITEYGDIACLNAGRYIKKKDKNIKTVAYFIDALYCGAKPSYMSEETKNKMSLFWENRMLKNFDRVIMMEAVKKTYCGIKSKLCYYDRLIFLDIPMMTVSKYINDKKQGDNHNRLIRFVYVGSIPKNIRNPEYVLELFDYIDASKWEFNIYGSCEYPDLIKKYESSHIIYKGRVNHDEVDKIMEEADFLINIGNSISGMVPSKIFEYMSTGKPIISTYKLQNDPCVKYLNLYKNAICIDENDELSKSEELVTEFVKNSINGNVGSDQLLKLTTSGGLLFNNTPKAFVECVEAFDEER